MSDNLDDLAQELHQSLMDLVRRYQFRDRQEICCYGISVSQCYALSALAEGGPLNMGALAASQQLTVSTMTRVVDQLVKKDLVERIQDPGDRRVCCVGLTAAGEKLIDTIHGELLEMEKEVLWQIRPEERAGVVKALKLLGTAVDQWRAGHDGAAGEKCC